AWAARMTPSGRKGSSFTCVWPSGVVIWRTAGCRSPLAARFATPSSAVAGIAEVPIALTPIATAPRKVTTLRARTFDSSIFGTQLIHLVRHQEWMRTHAVPGLSAFRPPPEFKCDGDRLKTGRVKY